MMKKKLQSVHTHQELVQAFHADSPDITSGFSVKSHVAVRSEDFNNEHFRTDYIIICMVTAGSLTLAIDLKKYTLPVNGFILAAPNALKKFVEVSEDATISVVSFTGDFLNRIGVSNLKTELFEYFSTKFSPFWQLDQEASDMLTRLMEDLERRNLAIKTHPFGKELLSTSFQTFLYEIAGLSKTYAQPVSNYVSRKENLVMEFLQLVQKHFKRQRSVSAYAEMLSITAKYLTETVKEITGRNAGEMIDDIVMLEAKYLLNDSSLSISQTADLLHFNDQSFFGKFFKRHAGISPKEYRKSL